MLTSIFESGTRKLRRRRVTFVSFLKSIYNKGPVGKCREFIVKPQHSIRKIWSYLHFITFTIPFEICYSQQIIPVHSPNLLSYFADCRQVSHLPVIMYHLSYHRHHSTPITKITSIGFMPQLWPINKPPLYGPASIEAVAMAGKGHYRPHQDTPN